MTKSPKKIEKAIFASGCFWGMQYFLQRTPVVISTSVGYTGGHIDSPTYDQVSTGQTGHVEAVEVVFNPERLDYETLTKLFFETHDPTQRNGQGPDTGSQYKSVIFYFNKRQKEIADKLIKDLVKKGLEISTELRPAQKFWPAELHHQDYYNKNGSTPYCHSYRKLF